MMSYSPFLIHLHITGVCVSKQIRLLRKKQIEANVVLFWRF